MILRIQLSIIDRNISYIKKPFFSAKYVGKKKKAEKNYEYPLIYDQ